MVMDVPPSDTTHAVVDLMVTSTSIWMPVAFTPMLTRLSGNDFQIQLKAPYRPIALRRRFPLVRIYLDTGRDNFIAS